MNTTIRNPYAFAPKLEDFANMITDRLPLWHFERYCQSQDLLCAFPPSDLGVSLEAWSQLTPYAVVWSVHGPYYVIRERK